MIMIISGQRPGLLAILAAASIAASISSNRNSILLVHSYVLNPNTNAASSAGGILSRFANVECELLMTVGRTPSTAMPPEWAASGAKLGLPLNIKFSTEACSGSYGMNEEALLAGPGPPMPLSPSFLAVEPLNDPSFTSANGVETVKVTPGAFSCLPTSATEQTQQYSFRFFLDFPEGAVRNDVVLPAERIYFMTACWNEDNDISKNAKRFKERVAKSLERTNLELRKMEKSPLKFRQYLGLMDRRRKLEGQMDMLEDTFPPGHRLIEGPCNVAFLKEGVIAVKRFGNGSGGGGDSSKKKEVYHWVGTFSFRKFLEYSGV